MSHYTALNTRAAGDLDPEFGENRDGKAVLRFPDITDGDFKGITEGPDGKLYIVGGVTPKWERSEKFGIARLHADGTADISFGVAGLASVPLKGIEKARANQIVFQTHENQQKILLCGYDWGSYRNVVVRLHENGQLDTSFGNEGFLTINPVVPVVDIAGDSGSGPAKANVSGESHMGPCTVAPDGRVYVVNNDFYIPQWKAAVIVLTRLNNDGSPDTRFNETGSVVIPVHHPFGGEVSDVLVHDSKITVCGYAGNDAMVARLNEDGSFDHGFGTEGFAMLKFNNDFSSGYQFTSLAIQTDGRVLAAGFAGNGRAGLLACFTVDGRLDRKFNLGAPIFEKFGAGTVSFGGISQIEGKIIVTGNRDTGNDAGFVVARYLSNGTLDPDFGGGAGWVYTTFGEQHPRGNTMAVQKNGKILVLGTWNYFDDTAALIARYLNPL
jgi:uncharacterized delta-60 repeat protein